MKAYPSSSAMLSRESAMRSTTALGTLGLSSGGSAGLTSGSGAGSAPAAFFFGAGVFLAGFFTASGSGWEALAASARAFSPAARMTSMYTNLSHATMKGAGVFFSPMP